MSVLILKGGTMARIGKAQKEAIRNSIIEVSRRLFVEQGYDKTSTSLIAKEVGIAEGTVFNYFKKKSDILVEVFASDYLRSMDEGMPIDYESGVVEIYTSFYEKSMERILKLPRKIMLEMFIIAMNANEFDLRNNDRVEAIARNAQIPGEMAVGKS